MRNYSLLFLLLGCGNASLIKMEDPVPITSGMHSVASGDTESWSFFLQHLPVTTGKILDYRGKPVPDQDKQAGIISFDVGARDLQQCADALMRLRAEYLFARQRYEEIGFHFVSGQLYAWKDYCKGLRPVARGNAIVFTHGATAEYTHESLRNYLDLVYTYASTISLAKELKPASDFAIGTIIIHAGSPGHCFIIIDEARNTEGAKVFKLAEGYTPAQSIYVLRNPEEAGTSPWYKLSKGTISTASYTFTSYQLKKFE
jgi:hypothetical protein